MMLDALPARWRSWYEEQAPLVEIELGLSIHDPEPIVGARKLA